MRHSVKRVLFAGAAASALSWGIAPAMAQDEDAAPAASDARVADTIVVTARRREESLQDTPVAVTVANAEKLERVGATDITSIQELTPNATVEVARGTNSTLIAFIRGVGQQDPLWGFEPGVGLYVDDVYIARPQGAVLDIFDIERIEVLRGPQGTLYGRNTIGGAIKYVTKRLDMTDPTLTARINVGNYNQFDQIISGSVPLGGNFAIGAAIANYQRDGYGENLFTGADHYNKDVLAGRISLEWAPTDDLFVRLSADRTEDDSNAKHGHRLLPGVTNGEPVTDDVFDTRGGAGDENSVETQGASLTAEWVVNDFLTVKSITAMREDETVTPIDFDALPFNDFDVPAFYENEQFTQEFLANFETDRLSGVAGLYYLDGQYKGAFDVVLGTFGINAPTFGDVGKESIAAFADVTYDLSDQWSVSVGGRYTEDETSATVIRETYLGTGPSPFLGGPDVAPLSVNSDFTNSRTDDRFSPRVSLSFEPSETLTLYGSYAEGFKSGGFDPRAAGVRDLNGDGAVNEADFADNPALLLVFNGFAPEIVDSFELGAKGSILDGRVLYNAALFYSEYTDQQITVQDGVDTDGDGENDNFVSTVLNAGESEYVGLELEGTAFLTDVLSVDFMLGYIDAEINEIISNGENIADDFVTQNTPELTWRVGLNADLPLPSNLGDLRLTGAVSFRDEYNLFNVDNEGSETDPALPAGTPPLDPEDYYLLDASAIWDFSDRWQFSIIGRNLTDEEYRIAAYNFAGSAQLGADGAYSAFYGPPRTITASVQFKY